MTPDLLHRLGDHPDVTVEIVTGTEHWLHGVVTLSVRGDGGVEVHNLRSGSEQRFDGRLDGAGVDALGRALAALELPGRSGVTEPDDVPVKVAVRRDGQTLDSGEAWYSRRYDDPRLDDVLRRYQAVVEAVTAGRLPYGEVEGSG